MLQKTPVKAALYILVVPSLIHTTQIGVFVCVTKSKEPMASTSTVSLAGIFLVIFCNTSLM
jgi:hypothetical protein